MGLLIEEEQELAAVSAGGWVAGWLERICQIWSLGMIGNLCALVKLSGEAEAAGCRRHLSTQSIV